MKNKADCVIVDNLSVSFGKEKILENFSFKLKEGQKLALTGNSGSGKTSVLNILAGFIPDFTGNIDICGKKLTANSISEIRKNIAWVPQETNLQYDSVRKLILAPFEFINNKNILPSENEILKILSDFLLEKEILNKSTFDISGGQKQRVMLAGAVLLNKPLLLLDEPSSALDDDSKRAVIERILSQNNTIICSTHDKLWIDKSDIVINLDRK